MNWPTWSLPFVFIAVGIINARQWAKNQLKKRKKAEAAQ